MTEHESSTGDIKDSILSKVIDVVLSDVVKPCFIEIIVIIVILQQQLCHTADIGICTCAWTDRSNIWRQIGILTHLVKFASRRLPEVLIVIASRDACVTVVWM